MDMFYWPITPAKADAQLRMGTSSTQLKEHKSALVEIPSLAPFLSLNTITSRTFELSLQQAHHNSFSMRAPKKLFSLPPLDHSPTPSSSWRFSSFFFKLKQQQKKKPISKMLMINLVIDCTLSMIFFIRVLPAELSSLPRRRVCTV